MNERGQIGFASLYGLLLPDNKFITGIKELFVILLMPKFPPGNPNGPVCSLIRSARRRQDQLLNKKEHHFEQLFSFNICIMKIIYLGLFLLSLHAKAQKMAKVVAADVISIHSDILNEDRKLYIYTPSENTIYAPSTYPVIYLLDGAAHINMVAGQIQYLSESYPVLPKMIVVGIANNNRARDLTPTHARVGYDGKPDSISVYLSSSGGGEKFLHFIEEELVPYIDEHYRTAPYRIFSGHSLGGLMTLYCMIENPALFNAYISISPALWWDNRWILKRADKNLTEDQVSDKILFFSDGKEGGQFHKDALSLDSLLKKRELRRFRYEYKYYPEESHIAEPVKAFYDAIRFVFPHWYPEAMDTSMVPLPYKVFELHYRDLSRQYGYTIMPPEEVINTYGYSLLDEKKMDEALIFLQKNVENYPDSYNVYDSYGEALMLNGRVEEATWNYEKSLELNPNNENAKQKLKILKADQKK
jgi:predicted alpha/beta superfamily hydrolase